MTQGAEGPPAVGGRPDIGRRILRQDRAGQARHLTGGLRLVGADNEVVPLVARAFKTETGIRHAGQYTYTVPDFTVDSLELWATESDRPPDSYDQLLSPIELLGRNLSDCLTRLDGELADARTGRLVRIFIVAERGAVHCNEVTIGRHLVVVSLPAEAAELTLVPAREADSEVADLTNRLRDVLKQKPFDYGGWLGYADRDAVAPDPECGLTGRSVEPFVEDRDADAARACLAQVACQDLHYAAVYSDGERIAAADVMHHRDLERYLYNNTVDDRRRFYAALGLRISDYVRELAAPARQVIGRSVRHLVLDVERGAVYFHRIRPRAYVVGVTLDQSQVAAAEQKVVAIARELGA